MFTVKSVSLCRRFVDIIGEVDRKKKKKKKKKKCTRKSDLPKNEGVGY